MSKTLAQSPPLIQDPPNIPKVTPHPLPYSDGDITITHAPRLSTGRVTTLQDRLLAAKERNALQPVKGSTRDPRDKYTKGIMPKVHVASPTATLDLIDIDLVIEWENYDLGKLIAIPFGNEAENRNNHPSIAKRLLTAATEITQADDLGISTPIPNEEAILHGTTPISFLIYKLTYENITTLLQRSVWSSPAITFRVIHLHPPCPEFLFTLKDFTMRDDTTILNIVKSTWQSVETQKLINDIIDSFIEDNHSELRNNINAFLISAHIKRLNYRAKGNIEVPRFNVYADSQFILDDDVWFHLRNTLANLTYKSPMQGQGTTVIPLSTCTICHGVDHPTGMCDFPNIEGWNGPTRESLGNTQLQYGTKNKRTRGLRQISL